MEVFFQYPLVAILVMIGSLIFIHELGHFLVGRWCGIGVIRFSIGFGPKVMEFTRGGTKYSIAPLPLGGYVQFLGSYGNELEDTSHVKGKAFHEAPRWQRAATLFAGPFANILLAFAIFTVLGLSGVNRTPAMVGQVLPGSAAEKYGLLPGDRIVDIDGIKVNTWQEMVRIISKSAEKKLEVSVARTSLWVAEGESPKIKTQVLQVTPGSVEARDWLGRKGKLGRVGISLGSIAPVVYVLPGSRADRLGFKTGDRISQLKLAGKAYPVNSFPHLNAMLTEYFAMNRAAGVENQIAAVVNSVDTASKGKLIKEVVLGSELSSLGIRDMQLVIDKDELNPELKKGDYIVSVAKTPVGNLYDLSSLLEEVNKESVVATIIPAGSSSKTAVSKTLKTKAIDRQELEGRVTYNILATKFLYEPEIPKADLLRFSNPFSAAVFGAKETAKQTRDIGFSLWQLISGKLPLKALGGPISIANVAKDAAKMGWRVFLFAMALISINLAIVNMVPLPALDGGHLALLSFEAIRGRSLSVKGYENFQKLGFAVIISLFVIVFSNDLSRYWADIVGLVVGK